MTQNIFKTIEFCRTSEFRQTHLADYIILQINILLSGLELAQTTFAGTVHYGIFCKKTVISKGSKLGPFRGKQVNTSEIKTNDDNSFMWEVSSICQFLRNLNSLPTAK